MASGPVKTTSRGQCRSCQHEWAVPQAELRNDLIRQEGGISYVEGLPRRCPRCGSPKVAWLFDDRLVWVVVDWEPRLVRAEVWTWAKVRAELGVPAELGLGIESTAGLALLLEPGGPDPADRFEEAWHFEPGHRYETITAERRAGMVAFAEVESIEPVLVDEEAEEDEDQADWWKRG